MCRQLRALVATLATVCENVTFGTVVQNQDLYAMLVGAYYNADVWAETWQSGAYLCALLFKLSCRVPAVPAAPRCYGVSASAYVSVGVGPLQNFCKPTYKHNTFNIETYTVAGYTMDETKVRDRRTALWCVNATCQRGCDNVCGAGPLQDRVHLWTESRVLWRHQPRRHAVQAVRALWCRVRARRRCVAPWRRDSHITCGGCCCGSGGGTVCFSSSSLYSALSAQASYWKTAPRGACAPSELTQE
jgi:hypothetical protein